MSRRLTALAVLALAAALFGCKGSEGDGAPAANAPPAEKSSKGTQAGGGIQPMAPPGMTLPQAGTRSNGKGGQ